MTLRSKLLLALLPMAGALILLSVSFYRATRSLGVQSESILKDNFRSMLALQRMGDALDALDVDASRMSQGALPSAPPGLDLAQQRFEGELEVQEHNITEPGEAAATKRLRTEWDRYRAGLREISRDPERAKALYASELQPAVVRVRAAATEILALNTAPILRKNDRVRALVHQFDAVLVFAALAACGMGLVASGSLTARILRPLGVLGQTVRRIGEGDLDARLSLGGRDELAGLARDINGMSERLRRYRESSLGELLEAQHAAQAAIDSLSDPVVVFDTQRRVVNVNRAAEALLHAEPGEALPPSLQPDARQALERVATHVLQGRGPYVPRGFEEALRLHSPGADHFLLPRGHPVYSAEGAVAGATVVLQDVTRIRLFDELKNDLVATVAHEFRTPLTSLRMAVHLCLEGLAGPITEKQADLLQAAREDCERLQGMVDDLLNVARLQAGKGGLDEREVAVQALLDALEAHRKDADERGVRFVIEPAPAGLKLTADPDRLELVFANFISNALQHTPAGGAVEVRVRPEEGWVRFEVADTGSGVPAEYRSRIFERFFQVPGAKAGAAGLGLYIAREVVRAHGGDIGVDVQDGKGSTFWFTLPLRPAG